MTTKEKFEEAKRLYETANADQRYVLESLFPELRESEDERIRKEIVSAIKEDWPGHTDWIAWLEKQAQKPAWTGEDKNMLKWVIGYLENKMLNTPISEERTACKNAIAWFKKLEGEQKPTDNVEQKKLKKTKFKTGDRIIGIVSGMQYYITGVCDDHYCTESGCIIMFCAQENFELYKQKPAWSEEDKRKIDRIYSILRQASDTHAFSTTCRLIGDKECIELQDFLKSLGPQPQWKPSDEQMKALEESIMFLGTSWVSTRQFALELLYQDLKKLKE